MQDWVDRPGEWETYRRVDYRAMGERVIERWLGALLTLAWRKHAVMGLETVTVLFFFFPSQF